MHVCVLNGQRLLSPFACFCLVMCVPFFLFGPGRPGSDDESTSARVCCIQIYICVCVYVHLHIVIDKWMENSLSHLLACLLGRLIVSFIYRSINQSVSQSIDSFMADLPSSRNLLDLRVLDQQEILSAIQQWFEKQTIYSCVGPVLIAINPYQYFDIYSPSVAEGFRAHYDRAQGASAR